MYINVYYKINGSTQLLNVVCSISHIENLQTVNNMFVPTFKYIYFSYILYTALVHGSTTLK